MFVLYRMLLCYWDLCSTIEERRKMKRTSEPGDVTTELATAPGETGS